MTLVTLVKFGYVWLKKNTIAAISNSRFTFTSFHLEMCTAPYFTAAMFMKIQGTKVSHFMPENQEGWGALAWVVFFWCLPAQNNHNQKFEGTIQVGMPNVQKFEFISRWFQKNIFSALFREDFQF